MPRTCIFQPSPNRLSETFIQSHIDRLPNVVGVIHKQDAIPAINGKPLLSQRVHARLRRKLMRVATRRSWDFEIQAGFSVAFRRLRPEVVLAEFGTSGVEILSACLDARIPLVVHFHGLDASMTHVLEIHRDSYRKMFKSAAAVIAVSRAMEKKLVAIGCPEEKLVYSPYGIDCTRFVGADPLHSTPQFVSVGRFVEKKAPHLTLLAFARVLNQMDSARLRMIGDGPYLDMCRDLAVGLRIDHAVNFLGGQSHSVVRQEMRAARAFVQHSVTASSGDSEGTPVAILEAGAIGLPVVATRHAGIPDVVLEGQTGLLVDERDVEAMGTHMLLLARDAMLAAEMGRNASVHIKKFYTIEQSIRRLSEVLDAAAKHDAIAQTRERIECEFVDSAGKPLSRFIKKKLPSQ